MTSVSILAARLARHAALGDPPVRIWLTQHDWIGLLRVANADMVRAVSARVCGVPVSHIRYDMPSRVVFASGRSVRWSEIVGR